MEVVVQTTDRLGRQQAVGGLRGYHRVRVEAAHGVGAIVYLVTPVQRATVAAVRVHLLGVGRRARVIWVVLVRPAPCPVQ